MSNGGFECGEKYRLNEWSKEVNCGGRVVCFLLTVILSDEVDCC